MIIRTHYCVCITNMNLYHVILVMIMWLFRRKSTFFLLKNPIFDENLHLETGERNIRTVLCYFIKTSSPHFLCRTFYSVHDSMVGWLQHRILQICWKILLYRWRRKICKRQWICKIQGCFHAWADWKYVGGWKNA